MAIRLVVPLGNLVCFPHGRVSSPFLLVGHHNQYQHVFLILLENPMLVVDWQNFMFCVSTPVLVC